MNTCRLCLYQSKEPFVSIWDNDIEDLPGKILNCVSINVTQDDNLPSTVCVTCMEEIRHWERFKNDCQKSNEVLLKASVETLKDDDIIVYVTEESVDSDERLKRLKKEDLETDKVFSPIYVNSDNAEFKDEIYINEEFLDSSSKFSCTEDGYQCDICATEFETCFDFLDHQETHNGESVFLCDKCPEKFSVRQELVEHDKNHRTSCHLCGKLILKTSMNLHLIKHTDKFKCHQCGGRFNSKAALSQHMITVHTDRKDHICETCGKRFSSQTSMRVHLKSHSNKRLYKCKLCSYAGRTASAVYVHMSTHANDLCVCEVCSKTFKSNRNLNDHLRRFHAKEKKHECTYCGKKFVDKYMLSVHLRCHTGVRPYKCKFCEKTFIRADSLKDHVAIHGKRVLQECKRCGKPFISKRGLSRHNCIAVA